MSVPSSTIYIISGVPLNQSYEHTLWFPSELAQQNYFKGKITQAFANFTYLRPDNKIKVAGVVPNARAWNYLMFQNDDGKWYYHFIDKVTYLNDSAVELHITLDVIQTFMFDWELKPCFIERTHTESDEFGEHTLPEGLETGPLVRYATHEINLEDNVILVMMTATEEGNFSFGDMYGGIFSALSVYAVKPTDVSRFNSWLLLADAQVTESILSMWMYPKDLVSVADNWTGTGVFHKVNNVAKVIDVDVPNKINENYVGGYPVKNKKTLCYPYTMLYVSNNMGGCAVYHRERFNNNDKYEFRIHGAMSPDAGLQLVPNDYKQVTGASLNFEEGLAMPAFPTCAWVSDTYKVWLAQNQNQMNLAERQAMIQAVVGGATAVASIPFGNVAGAMGGLGVTYNAYNTIQGLMAQKADMAVQPDQARGNHSGNINLTHGRMGYSVHFMTITPEYAEKIDDYFTRYGYLVNQIATPKIRNRELFTYVKTVGSLVTGNLGTEDQLKIQAIFDKGITFWTDPEKVGYYFNNNDPV